MDAESVQKTTLSTAETLGSEREHDVFGVSLAM